MYTCSLAEPATRAPQRRRTDRVDGVVAARRQRRASESGWPEQWALRWRLAACDLVVGDVRGDLDRLALHGTVAEHGDDGRRRRRQGDDLHGAHGDGLGLRPDDDGGVVGQPGEQVRRAMEHLLEPPVGGGEELADGGTGVMVEQSGCGEMVDEEAVALVRRDPPGRGVRLDEIALLFEHGHLVAHGRRRDARSRARRRCGSSPPAAPWRCTPARPRSGSPSSARPAWCYVQVIDGEPPAWPSIKLRRTRGQVRRYGRQVADVLIPFGMGEVAAGEPTGSVDPVLRVEVPDDDSLSRVDGGLHPIAA